MKGFPDQQQRTTKNLRALERCPTPMCTALGHRGLSEQAKQEIRDFALRRVSEGASTATVAKLVSSMHNALGKFAPPGLALNDATEANIRTIVIGIEGSEYSAKTKVEVKKALKSYFKSIGQLGRVSFIRTTLKRSDRVLPTENDLITREETGAMVDVCRSSRDKALIALLAESGMRIGELGSLQIKHVSFDQSGVVVVIPQGKTGARRIRLVECERFLRMWILEHPFRDDSEAWLWVSQISSVKRPRSERMNYGALRMLIVKKAMLADVKTYRTAEGKPRTQVHPHLFRHSAATRLAKFMTEQQLKIYLGWTAASEMAGVYVHLSGKDVDDAILAMHGLKKDEERPTAVRCAPCGYPNPADSKVCGRCFRPLSTESAQEVDQQEKNAARLWDVILGMKASIDELNKAARKM